MQSVYSCCALGQRYFLGFSWCRTSEATMDHDIAADFKKSFLSTNFDKDEFIMEQLQHQRLASLQHKLLEFMSQQKHQV